ncbi:MAG: BspA family leucine-rich repeat surface protein [Firmicutes bacterium]|nr:BspA family leucine-rich repeat surface protein [Bacillota bacterium]
MKNKYKIILIICIIIGICSILVGSIAYYRIVVEGSIKASTGNAVFVLKDENSNVWNNKEINLGKVNPGDSGSFTVTMDAGGSTVDMYATLELDRGNLPTNLKFYTTSDHKSELHKYYSFLEHSGTKSETLTIYWYWNPYIDDIEDSKFINIDSIEANIRVSAVQISEYAMMKNGYSSDPSANGGTEFWNNTYKPYIRTITFGNDLSNLPSSCTEENLCWDISDSSNQNKKVYAYLIDSGLKESNDTTKTLYNLYIAGEAPIFAPANCDFIFSFAKNENSKNVSNLISIDFNNNFNTSKVIDMNWMFYYCSSLTSLDLSSFNTSNVTDMSGMFYVCSSLTSLDLSSFNTSNVTIMNGMFYYCSSLTSLDLSSFNTSNVTNMIDMFNGCSSLTSLDLSSFNTSKVTYISQMFYNCSSLTTLDLSSFNTSKVTSMNNMFNNCSSLTNLDLSSFNTSNVTSMSSMFFGCSSLTTLNLSNFNTSKVTNKGSMFSGCRSLTSLDLSSFNTSNVTDMSGMFSGCSSLTSLDLSNFNTSKVTKMWQMFNNCSILTSLDLSSFNTSKVTSMSRMFYNCKKLTTQINIMNAGITSYTQMFIGAATDSNAQITVNYIAAASTLVDNMIATKSSNSNVVKGKQL